MYCNFHNKERRKKKTRSHHVIACGSKNKLFDALKRVNLIAYRLSLITNLACFCPASYKKELPVQVITSTSDLEIRRVIDEGNSYVLPSITMI